MYDSFMTTIRQNYDSCVTVRKKTVDSYWLVATRKLPKIPSFSSFGPAAK